MERKTLDNIKIEFVEKSINNGNYKELPKAISKGKVLRISGYGNIEKDGFEHGFLYFEEGSQINKHVNLNNVQLYRMIFGDNKSLDKLCLLGDIYEINNIDCDTIIEYFEVNKSLYSHVYNYIMLNELLEPTLYNKFKEINELIYNIGNNEIKDGYDPELKNTIKNIYFHDEKGIQKVKKLG